MRLSPRASHNLFFVCLFSCPVCLGFQAKLSDQQGKTEDALRRCQEHEIHANACSRENVTLKASLAAAQAETQSQAAEVARQAHLVQKEKEQLMKVTTESARLRGECAELQRRSAATQERHSSLAAGSVQFVP